MTDEDIKKVLDYCLSKPGAYIDFPFGETPICVKVGKRLFAQVYPKKGDQKITLNCDITAGEFFRSMYPGTVKRGYHSPPQLQPYFNTVNLNGEVPEAELKIMIDHSYSTVFKKLPRRTQEEIASAASK